MNTVNAIRSALSASAAPTVETLRAGRTCLALAPITVPTLALAILSAPFVFIVVLARKLNTPIRNDRAARLEAQRTADLLAIAQLDEMFAAPAPTAETSAVEATAEISAVQTMGEIWERELEADINAGRAHPMTYARIEAPAARKPRTRKAPAALPETKAPAARKPRTRKAPAAAPAALPETKAPAARKPRTKKDAA